MTAAQTPQRPSFRGGIAEPGIQSYAPRGFAMTLRDLFCNVQLWIPGSAARPRNDGALGGCVDGQ